jgi:hypothetical protein
MEYSRVEMFGDQPYWNIRLNKYQRDNLLWLLTLCWQGHIPGTNTGDWVGEIPWLLRYPCQNFPELGKDDRPNVSLDEYIKNHGVKPPIWPGPKK